MGVHSRVSPSGLTRIKLCPGSVKATAHLPRTTNLAAAEGTLLHEIASDCLDLGFEPHDYVGRTMTADGVEFEVGLEPGQVDPTVMYDALDWIRDQPGRLFVEQTVKLDPWLPGQFGQLDVGLMDGPIYPPDVAFADDGGVCTIFDWKFGAGVLVQVIGNDQLRAYALGFYTSILLPLGYRPTRFRIIIEQPRCQGGARYFQPWEITLEELLPFGTTMEEILAAADAPDAPRIAGEKQCLFCAAKFEFGGCAAYNEFQLDIVSQKFDDLDDGYMFDSEPRLPDPKAITPERRSYIVKHAAMFKKWLSTLDAEMLTDAIAGRPTPGMKCVAGQKSDRKWRDKEAAEALLVNALADEAFNHQLKSPAQSEKSLKPRRGHPGNATAWDRLGKLITQDDGRPILVPDTDPRPALLTVDQKFEDEPETD